MSNKIRFIESSQNSERNFHYSTFFSSIQVHLMNRLELILEYKICQAINKNYAVPDSPTGLKPADWMQKLIDEVFRSIARFKGRRNSQQLASKAPPAPASAIQSKIEQLYISKFNLFLIKVYDLTLRRQRKSIDQLRESLQYWMAWCSANYPQHVNTNNFPNYFLEILEQNYVHFEGGGSRFEGGRFEGAGNRLEGSRYDGRLNGGTVRFANGSIEGHHKSPVASRTSLIRGNQIAPQSVYESGSFDSASFTTLTEPREGRFRTVHFKSDVQQRLRISNRKAFLKAIFCFDNT